MDKRRISSSSNRPPPSRPANLLLAALPDDDYQRVAATLDIIPLVLKHVLHSPGEVIEQVYFPGGGFCSMLTVLKDGAMVEVATIGREGVVGVGAVLDVNPLMSIAMVQGEADGCYRMAASVFRGEMERRGAFYELMTRYTHALMGFVMQSTACNATHTVEW